MAEQIQPETKQIMIAEGQRFAPYLKRTVGKYSYCRYTITAERDIHVILLKDILKEFPRVTVEKTSIYEYEFLKEKFDLIMSVPTMGRRNRVDDFARFMCRDYEMVALENLLLHLSPNGKLVIVMPAKIAFGGGCIKDLRDFVQEMYCLEEIVVIRPRHDLLDGIYLKMFLDSPLGGKILSSAQQGTVVVNLSFRDLQEIEIPFPPIAEHFVWIFYE